MQGRLPKKYDNFQKHAFLGFLSFTFLPFFLVVFLFCFQISFTYVKFEQNQRPFFQSNSSRNPSPEPSCNLSHNPSRNPSRNPSHNPSSIWPVRHNKLNLRTGTPKLEYYATYEEGLKNQPNLNIFLLFLFCFCFLFLILFLILFFFPSLISFFLFVNLFSIFDKKGQLYIGRMNPKAVNLKKKTPITNSEFNQKKP